MSADLRLRHDRLLREQAGWILVVVATRSD